MATCFRAIGFLTLGIALVIAMPVMGGGKTTETFLAKALDVNQCEVDAAKKAATNATRKDVRQFAEKMAEGHTQLGKDLMEAAKDAKIGVVSGLGKDHVDAMVKLMTLKGNDFDAAFLDYVVDAHKKAIKLFEDEGMKASGAAKKVAEKALPEMRRHLETAQALRKAQP